MTASDELREAAARLRTARFTGAVTMTPAVAGLIAAREPLAGVFDAWARMADMDPDLLNRVGGPETLAVARQILGSTDG